MRPPLLHSLLSAALVAAFAPLANIAHAAGPAACATFDKQALAVAPSANLCVAGTASAVQGSGPWSWTCSGGSGSVANCSATVASAEPQAVAEVPPRVARIGEWATCDGVSDETQNVANAFAAAKGNALHLLIDCEHNLKVGMDIARTIFVDNDVTVKFAPNGLFITDNVQIPTFAIINSNNVTFLDWRIKYIGGLPTKQSTGGYFNNGLRVSSDGKAPASDAFASIRQKAWMEQNRQVEYLGSKPFSAGPTNSSALIYIKGSTSNLIVQGMKLFVPDGAKPSRFIPVAFTIEFGEKSGVKLPANKFNPPDPAYYVLPSNLEFTNIEIDGSYMGWVGNVKNARFTNIQSRRYADLQNDAGGEIGGVDPDGVADKWFAPPHLFYLGGGNTITSAIPQEDVTITNVVDYGIREGLPRDKAGDVPSGNASSIKIGGKKIVVDNYKSYRPDGFLDVLTSDGAKISNSGGTCNTAFLNHMYPCLRFPLIPVKNVTLETVHIADIGAETKKPPAEEVGIRPDLNLVNTFNTFTDVTVSMNEWTGVNKETGLLDFDSLRRSGIIHGDNNNTNLVYLIKRPASKPMTVSNGMANEIFWSLTTNPSVIKKGEKATIYFRGWNTQNCVLSGRANARFNGSHTLSVVPSEAGVYQYIFTCGGAPGSITSGSVTSTLTVTN